MQSRHHHRKDKHTQQIGVFEHQSMEYDRHCVQIRINRMNIHKRQRRRIHHTRRGRRRGQ